MLEVNSAAGAHLQKTEREGDRLLLIIKVVWKITTSH